MPDIVLRLTCRETCCQGRRNPPWTRVEKLVLALDIGLSIGTVVLYAELFVL